jgi:hypothetical protein
MQDPGLNGITSVGLGLTGTTEIDLGDPDDNSNGDDPAAVAPTRTITSS